jgi:hypothetical protein
LIPGNGTTGGFRANIHFSSLKEPRPMQRPRRLQRLLIFSAILLSLWMGRLPAQPAAGGKKPDGPKTVVPPDLHVDAANAGAQDGSAQRPYRTVQQAINAAKANTVIAVAGGTYPQNIRVREKAVRLYGGFIGGTKASYASGKAGNFAERDPAAYPSHLQGDGKDSVVTLYEAGASVVDGFLVTGGGRSAMSDTSRLGGGFYVYEGAPTISNNVIEKNQTCLPVKQEDQDNRGGGIYSAAANLSILNNIIRNNVSGRGAGIAAEGKKMIIRGNLVQNNIGVSDHGGGIHLFSENAEISHNRIEGNEIGRALAYGWGGGIIVVNKGGHYQFSHNLFTRNFAPSVGSAFFADDGAVASLDHDLFYANAPNPAGNERDGAVPPVYVDGNADGLSSNVTFNHVTIADHAFKGSTKGSAITVQENSKVIVKNSILWNNGGDDIEVDATSKATITYTLTQKAFKGTGNLTKDPLFVNPAARDYRLRSTAGRWDPSANGMKGGWVTDSQHSPAIDAGDPASPFNLEPAPNGGRANLGAYGNSAQASKSAK